ncbi:MAG: hypothetical protein JWO02_3395 [Solirubrobacterales bacterium]|nr:hypothetical protein [Solirubrobacterales bacterium]
MLPRGRTRLAAVTVVAAVAGTPTAAADAATSTYTRCGAVPGTVFVEAARAGCAEVEIVATAVAAAPAADAAGVLSALGWSATRALPASGAAVGQYDLVAVRGTGALRIRRVGRAPSLDGWSAGRELVFARGTIVGGRPIPRDAAFCTSAFLVRLRGGAPGGLSAAHCAGLRSDGLVQRRNAALRRPPQPGIVLGRVLAILTRSAPLDALVLPVPRGAHRTAAPVVDRGISRPPWAVAGTAQLLAGRAVCFTGRTSGADQCGRLGGASARPLERVLDSEFHITVRCTTITARAGDSGGPVYTAPRADGTVRAIGIVTLVSGPSQLMCFTPVTPVLRDLGAALVATG